MKKKGIYIGILLALICAVVIGVFVPYLGAESAMPSDGILTLRQQEDESWYLSWPQADEADRYLVEILAASGEGQKPQVLYTAETDDHENFPLPEVEGDCLLRVNTVVEYFVLGAERIRYGSAPLEAAVRLDAPTVTEPEWTADVENISVHVSFCLENADACMAYRITETNVYEPLQLLPENAWTINFGEGGDLPFPEVGQSYDFALAASRKVPGLEIYGPVSVVFSVDRQDLLGRDLQVQLESREDSGFTLTWNETKGEYYEVQQLERDDQWVTLCRIGLEEERRYESGPLAKYSNFTYRVVAAGGYYLDEEGYAAQSDTIHFATKASPMYATVWPVKDLKAYFDVKKTAVYTSVKTGKAYCVVDEKDGMFGVRIGDQIGYIDSNYCMINLPDYMGQLCSYRIANSTSSIYKIHDLDIPNVTGVVTRGYEQVRQPDGSDLVPLLYPTAKKLMAAAQEAVNRGYRLRIYDSFRPQVATWEIYDRTAAILDQPAPATGKTYRQMMLDGRFALNSFLAKGTSRHNLGVALDLTLEDGTSGEAMGMQSAMHDLSWHSVTGRNNANAKTLASIMTGAGFTGLSTEWWHFQDDVSKNQLALPAVRNGVSAEGWACDAWGWRYRDARGKYVQDATIRLEGTDYTFDESGYLTEGQPAFG